jgi:hypothetical protein
MPDVGYMATTSAVVINNAAGRLATAWDDLANATLASHASIVSLGHDGLVRKGFDDTGPTRRTRPRARPA